MVRDHRARARNEVARRVIETRWPEPIILGNMVRERSPWAMFSALVVVAMPSCGLSDSADEATGGSSATTGGRSADSGGTAISGGSGAGRQTTGGQSPSGGKSSTTGGQSPGGAQSVGGEQASGGAGIAVPGCGAEEFPGISRFEELFSAQCEAAAACCSERGLGIRRHNCPQEFRQAEFEALASRENVELDPEVLERCTRAYQAVPTTCSQTGIAEACRELFVGTLSAGERCSMFEQCDRTDGPVLCRFAPSDPQGTCLPVVRGEEGQRCSDDCPSIVECSRTEQVLGDPLEPDVLCFEDDGLYCSVSESPPVCRRIHALGEECESGRSCGHSAARCRSICEPRSELGEPCQTNQRDDCTLELRCSGTSEIGECAAYEFPTDPTGQVCAL
jgi:hypothetical protein